MLALTLTFGAPAAAQNYPSYRDVYGNDFADLLTKDEEESIRHDLIGLFDKSGIEAVVVTVTTMRQFGHSGQIEPFATGLFNDWGVGDAVLNNGVMLLVAKDDRQMRIELGSGYTRATDAKMKRIIDQRMLPEFRNGRYGPGILSGTDDLVQVLLDRVGLAQPVGLFEKVQRDVQNMSGTALLIFVVLGAALLGLAFRLYQFVQRRRPRHCPADATHMDLMAEALDDSKLVQGQTIEERLGSVDYDVWQCSHCQHITIEAYPRWLTRSGACRACHFRTAEGTTTVLREATTSETGLKRVDYHCHNCSDEWSQTKSIPKVSESGSTRSYFSGGSSSGGGASGRW